MDEAPDHWNLYDGAEVALDEMQTDALGMVKVVKLRLKTVVLTLDADAPGSTPWVVFPIEALQQLSEQLAGVVESAKRWTPGGPVEPIGSHVLVKAKDA